MGAMLWIDLLCSVGEDVRGLTAMAMGGPCLWICQEMCMCYPPEDGRLGALGAHWFLPDWGQFYTCGLLKKLTLSY